MEEFKFEDGTEIKFERIKTNRDYRIYISQPAKIPGESTRAILAYVNKELFDFDNNHRYSRVPVNNEFVKQMRIGVLADTTRIGIPAGAYVPLKWNAVMNRFEIYIDGLINDKLILDETVASKDTIDKVNNKATKEEVEEPVA